MQPVEGERLKTQFFPEGFIPGTAHGDLLARLKDSHIVVFAVRLKEVA